jgi:hypothetical protein
MRDTLIARVVDRLRKSEQQLAEHGAPAAQGKSEPKDDPGNRPLELMPQ